MMSLVLSLLVCIYGIVSVWCVGVMLPTVLLSSRVVGCNNGGCVIVVRHTYVACVLKTLILSVLLSLVCVLL